MTNMGPKIHDWSNQGITSFRGPFQVPCHVSCFGLVAFSGARICQPFDQTLAHDLPLRSPSLRPSTASGPASWQFFPRFPNHPSSSCPTITTPPIAIPKWRDHHLTSGYLCIFHSERCRRDALSQNAPSKLPPSLALERPGEGEKKKTLPGLAQNRLNNQKVGSYIYIYIYISVTKSNPQLNLPSLGGSTISKPCEYV